MGALLGTLAGIGTSVGGASMSMASCVACQACSCASSVACSYLCGFAAWTPHRSADAAPPGCGRAQRAARARRRPAHTCVFARCRARMPCARRGAPGRWLGGLPLTPSDLPSFVARCAARCAGPRPRRRWSRTRRASPTSGCSWSPSSARGSFVTTSRPSSARPQTTSSGEREAPHPAPHTQALRAQAGAAARTARTCCAGTCCHMRAAVGRAGPVLAPPPTPQRFTARQQHDYAGQDASILTHHSHSCHDSHSCPRQSPATYAQLQPRLPTTVTGAHSASELEWKGCNFCGEFASILYTIHDSTRTHGRIHGSDAVVLVAEPATAKT